MSTMTRDARLPAFALLAALAIPSTAHAEIVESRSQVKGHYAVAYVSSWPFVYFRVDRTASAEEPGGYVTRLDYQFENFDTRERGKGERCVLQDSAASIGPTKANLQIDTSVLVEGRDCVTKFGGNLTVRISWAKDGLTEVSNKGQFREERNFPDGTRFVQSGRGSSSQSTADVDYYIVGPDVGTIISQPGGGFDDAELGSFNYASLVREWIRGASPASP
jgi:hypothetical protein